MPTNELEVFYDANIPLDSPYGSPATIELPAARAVTEVFVWVGRRGAGKSYGCGVFVEELMEAGLQVVVVDVVGTWWGLRVGADGSPSGGYKIPVIGGDHGDIQIVAEGGAAVAAMLVDSGSSAVLDLSPLRKGARQRFMTDWGEEFFHRKKTDRSPVHVALEEAHTLIPQRVMKRQERMVGALEDLVRLGRNYGIGVSMLDQRPQSVNKDVLNQAEVLCAFQLTGAQERDAVRRWAEAKEIRKDGVNPNTTPFSELSSLPSGQCILWSPEWLKRCQRVQVARKRTFDASATPGRTEAVRARAMRAIDLAELERAMSKAAGEKSAPRAAAAPAVKTAPAPASESTAFVDLMNEKARLEEDLKLERQRAAQAVVEVDIARRDLTIVRDRWARALSAVHKLRDAYDELSTLLQVGDLQVLGSTSSSNGVRGTTTKAFGDAKLGTLKITSPDQLTKDETYETYVPTSADAHIIGKPLADRLKLTPTQAMKTWREGAGTHPYSFHDGDGPCGACAAPPLHDQSLAVYMIGTPDPSLTPLTRAFLNTLAQRGPLTRAEVLTRSGYARSGTTNKAFAEMVAKEWVVTGNFGNGGTPPQLSLTGIGASALGEFEPVPLPTLDKVERTFLTLLAQRGPTSRKVILMLISYARSGTTNKVFARLGTRGLTLNVGADVVITEWGREVLGAFEKLPQGATLGAKLAEGTAGDLDKTERMIFDAIWRAGSDGVSRKQALETAGYARSGTTNKAFAHLVSIGYCRNKGGHIAASEELYG